MATLEQLTELQNLNECALECTRQSRWKESTQRYLSDMLQKNLELREEILSGQYRVKPTIDFTLNERGHIRQIEAPVVRDRIVQKSLMKHVLTPSLTPYLIYDNYALKPSAELVGRLRHQILMLNKGDVNQDGFITIADVTALVNIILGKASSSTENVNKVADVNDDDAITIADVTALVNIILGK